MASCLLSHMNTGIQLLVIKGHEVDDGPYGGAGTDSWTDMLIAQNGETTGIEIITLEHYPKYSPFIVGIRFR